MKNEHFQNSATETREAPAGNAIIQRWGGGLIVIGVLGCLGFIGASTQPYGLADGEGVPQLNVRFISARHEAGYTVSRDYIGMVEARWESELGFELGGKLSAIHVDEGDRVHSGDVLAQLDTALLDVEREMLVDARKEAEAELELAAISRKRIAAALKSDAVSAQDWDDVDKRHKAKSAAFDQFESAIAMVDVKLEKATLRAPFDALIARRHVDEGRVIVAGSPAFRILETVQPEARVGVAGRLLEELAPGQRRAVHISDKVVAATIRSILPVREGRTRSVDVILTLDSNFDEIRRGDLVRLKLDRKVRREGFWLPLSALTESSRGLWSCYVALPLEGQSRTKWATHILKRRELEALHYAADRVFVRGTLSPEDLVVSNGLHRLVPGQLVRGNSNDQTYSEEH